MKFLPLVWRNLMRRKVRTFFTFACVFVSFVLFGFLMIVRTAFTMGVDFAGVDRLWLMNKVNVIVPLPATYLDDIMATPGVSMAVHATWFGGSYQGKPNQFAVLPTDIENYLKVYPEFKVPDDEVKAALADRQGAIVGAGTARRYGWKIGDHIPFVGDIYHKSDGSAWTFNIDGIYTTDGKADDTQFLCRYDYFDEARQPAAKGQVNWYAIRIADPSQAAQISATLDNKFANSPAETKTAPEKAALADFAKQTGDIGAMLAAILVVVLFNILLVAGNTMAQSVRERTNELGVLKALGFPDGRVLGLVLFESLFVAVLGGGLGLLTIWMLIDWFHAFTSAMLPVFALQPHAVALGVLLFVLLGVFAGLPPALAASRLKITDALRRG